MNIISIVMTHKEALPTVERHKEMWYKVPGEIYFISPHDSMMNSKFNNEIGIGEAEHHGEKSAQRIIKIFEYALSKQWDYLLLMEYDSFALDLPKDIFPEKGGVSTAVFLQNKPRKYRGKFFTHYPMLFDREGFIKVAKSLPKIVSNDRYFSDRFIGRAIEVSGIPVKDLKKTKRAFTKNTIEPKHYDKLRIATKTALFYHGVKTEEVLNIIMNK